MHKNTQKARRRRTYLSWYILRKGRDKRAAKLVEPAALGVDTPEGFYHNEMPLRSTLEERYIAFGGKYSVRES